MDSPASTDSDVYPYDVESDVAVECPREESPRAHLSERYYSENDSAGVTPPLRRSASQMDTSFMDSASEHSEFVEEFDEDEVPAEEFLSGSYTHPITEGACVTFIEAMLMIFQFAIK